MDLRCIAYVWEFYGRQLLPAAEKGSDNTESRL